jgi:hypothetical protein
MMLLIDFVVGILVIAGMLICIALVVIVLCSIGMTVEWLLDSQARPPLWAQLISFAVFIEMAIVLGSGLRVLL